MKNGRRDEQGSLSIYPDMGAAVEDGSYFLLNNAAAGIATTSNVTAFAATSPFLIINNANSASSQVKQINIMPDYISFIATAAGTGGTNLQCAVILDNVITRYSSGGSQITSLIYNADLSSPRTSAATIYAGALVATAASAAKAVTPSRFLKDAIPVVGDSFTLKFGGCDSPNYLSKSATMSSNIINIPKVAIPPGYSLLVYLWLPSQSAASSYIPEMAFLER